MAYLLVTMSEEESQALDRWQEENTTFSRAAAVRELLRRGLHRDEHGAPLDGLCSYGGDVPGEATGPLGGGKVRAGDEA